MFVAVEFTRAGALIFRITVSQSRENGMNIESVAVADNTKYYCMCIIFLLSRKVLPVEPFVKSVLNVSASDKCHEWSCLLPCWNTTSLSK